MSSVAGSLDLEAEDWLDIGDNVSLPSLSLDDVLNSVENLDTSASFLNDQDDGSSPLYGDQATANGGTVTPSTYQLDCAIRCELVESVTHQLTSLREKSGAAQAVAEFNDRIAVVTSKGYLFLFDSQGRLERFLAPSDDTLGAASCVAFSKDGKNVTLGFCKGAIKITSVRTGTVHHVLRDVVQPGKGVLQILYLGSAKSLLVLDGGGSVFEVRIRRGLTGVKNVQTRCVFSGCNGEVVQMHAINSSLIALMTVTKVLLISTQYGGSILCAFPLKAHLDLPPLLSHCTRQKDTRICVGRGDKLSIFRLHPANFGTKQRAATLLRPIVLPCLAVSATWISPQYIMLIADNGQIYVVDATKGSTTKSTTPDMQLIFATSDYKGIATGGLVSEAMRCIAESVCHPSICRWKRGALVLCHDGLYTVEPLTEEDQLEAYQIRRDYLSSCLYLLDLQRGKLATSERFRACLPLLLRAELRSLLTEAVDGCKAGRVAELVQHYKKYIAVLLKVSITTKMFDILYEEIWPRLEKDVLSRTALFEALDDWVLDGALVEPPPYLVSEYLIHLASESHFSQLQAAVVRFPIHCIDLHQVMSTCRQNGLYDGIIYVMNKALADYISPLEEMLENVATFAAHDVKSDAQIEQGNRLMLYLHCCLAGRAYPYGSLPADQAARVPLEVFRCISSLRGKDGSSANCRYPNLRLLLLFDAQQFVHVVCTCVDAPLFASETGRLQSFTETIGLLASELRTESALAQFLYMATQLVENGHILAPVDIIEAAITHLLQLSWQEPLSERHIVEVLRVVPQLNHEVVLRAAQSPMRSQICTFIYLQQRRFVDLVKCYMAGDNANEVFSVVRRLMASDMTAAELEVFSTFVQSLFSTLVGVDSLKSADLIIERFSHFWRTIDLHSPSERRHYFPVLMHAFDLKRERQETNLTGDEELDEQLFNVVFEGLSSITPDDLLDDTFQSLLAYWLPTGSKTDFCLNIAAEKKCVGTSIVLLEARGFVQRAFDLLFGELTKCNSDVEISLSWIDRLLRFCSRHAHEATANKWLMKLFRCVTESASASTSKGIDERLQFLCVHILDTGTEHVPELFDCLMEYPAFKEGCLRDYSGLLNEILKCCDFEETMLRHLLTCINIEDSDVLRSLLTFPSRRTGRAINGFCIKCGMGLNKSALSFSCGHIMHQECVSGERRCLCDTSGLRGLERAKRSTVFRRFRATDVRRRMHTGPEETRNIFEHWDEPMTMTPRGGGSLS